MGNSKEEKNINEARNVNQNNFLRLDFSGAMLSAKLPGCLLLYFRVCIYLLKELVLPWEKETHILLMELPCLYLM